MHFIKSSIAVAAVLGLALTMPYGQVCATVETAPVIEASSAASQGSAEKIAYDIFSMTRESKEADWQGILARIQGITADTAAQILSAKPSADLKGRNDSAFKYMMRDICHDCHGPVYETVYKIMVTLLKTAFGGNPAALGAFFGEAERGKESNLTCVLRDAPDRLGPSTALRRETPEESVAKWLGQQAEAHPEIIEHFDVKEIRRIATIQVRCTWEPLEEFEEGLLDGLMALDAPIRNRILNTWFAEEWLNKKESYNKYTNRQLVERSHYDPIDAIYEQYKRQAGNQDKNG